MSTSVRFPAGAELDNSKSLKTPPRTDFQPVWFNFSKSRVKSRVRQSAYSCWVLHAYALQEQSGITLKVEILHQGLIFIWSIAKGIVQYVEWLCCQQLIIFFFSDCCIYPTSAIKLADGLWILCLVNRRLSCSATVSHSTDQHVGPWTSSLLW